MFLVYDLITMNVFALIFCEFTSVFTVRVFSAIVPLFHEDVHFIVIECYDYDIRQ